MTPPGNVKDAPLPPPLRIGKGRGTTTTTTGEGSLDSPPASSSSGSGHPVEEVVLNVWSALGLFPPLLPSLKHKAGTGDAGTHYAAAQQRLEEEVRAAVVGEWLSRYLRYPASTAAPVARQANTKGRFSSSDRVGLVNALWELLFHMTSYCDVLSNASQSPPQRYCPHSGAAEGGAVHPSPSSFPWPGAGVDEDENDVEEGLALRRRCRLDYLRHPLPVLQWQACITRLAQMGYPRSYGFCQTPLYARVSELLLILLWLTKRFALVSIAELVALYDEEQQQEGGASLRSLLQLPAGAAAASASPMWPPSHFHLPGAVRAAQSQIRSLGLGLSGGQAVAASSQGSDDDDDGETSRPSGEGEEDSRDRRLSVAKRIRGLLGLQKMVWSALRRTADGLCEHATLLYRLQRCLHASSVTTSAAGSPLSSDSFFGFAAALSGSRKPQQQGRGPVVPSAYDRLLERLERVAQLPTRVHHRHAALVEVGARLTRLYFQGDAESGGGDEGEEVGEAPASPRLPPVLSSLCRPFLATALVSPFPNTTPTTSSRHQAPATSAPPPERERASAAAREVVAAAIQSDASIAEKAPNEGDDGDLGSLRRRFRSSVFIREGWTEAWSAAARRYCLLQQQQCEGEKDTLPHYRQGTAAEGSTQQEDEVVGRNMCRHYSLHAGLTAEIFQRLEVREQQRKRREEEEGEAAAAAAVPWEKPSVSPYSMPVAGRRGAPLLRRRKDDVKVVGWRDPGIGRSGSSTAVVHPCVVEQLERHLHTRQSPAELAPSSEGSSAQSEGRRVALLLQRYFFQPHEEGAPSTQLLPGDVQAEREEWERQREVQEEVRRAALEALHEGFGMRQV